MRRAPVLGAAALPLAVLLWDGAAASNAPPGHYTLTAGTALDNRTGLRWQRAFAESKGSDAMTWTEAAQACQTLALDGFSGWRLPNARELESLYDASRPRSSRTIDETVFVAPTRLASQTFWSATPTAADSAKIFTCSYFSTTYAKTNCGGLAKTEFGGARCVRDR